MLPVPKSETVEATDTDPPKTSCSAAKDVAGTLANELGKLGRSEPSGATPVAPRAAIVTVGDCRDCPDLTHNPEIADSRSCSHHHCGRLASSHRGVHVPVIFGP
jgi:hypothetical protein